MELGTTLSSWLQLALLVVFAALSAGEEPVLFCYYSSHARNREGVAKFVPEDIDPSLCTHVIYAFVDIVDGKRLQASSPSDLQQGPNIGMYARTMALKKQNPNLKVLAAVGGWRIGSQPFLPLVRSQRTRRIFVRNAIRFLRRHDFDGLDIDWEFPGTRGSAADDKYEFTKLLKMVQGAFQRESQQTGQDKLLLTVAAAGGSYFINLAYEPELIANHVDYLLVMTYNYHGSWNKFTGHHSGMYPRSDEEGGEREWNQEWTISFWLTTAGVPRDKLVVGIATYGMSFTLASPDEHGLKAEAVGGGHTGPYTREQGVLAYYEICEKLGGEGGWRSVWINDQLVPYAYHGDQWVGYDDTHSVTYKAQNIRQKGLAGAFIWSVEMDDFNNVCGSGKYPLLSTVAQVLRGPAQPSSIPQPDDYSDDDYDDDDYYDDDVDVKQSSDRPSEYREAPRRAVSGSRPRHLPPNTAHKSARASSRELLPPRVITQSTGTGPHDRQHGAVTVSGPPARRVTARTNNTISRETQCESVRMFLKSSLCRLYVICPAQRQQGGTVRCPRGMTYIADIGACTRLLPCPTQ